MQTARELAEYFSAPGLNQNPMHVANRKRIADYWLAKAKENPNG